MGFIDSYKHLEKLCGDMLQTQHGVSAYIAEMESTPNGSYRVQGWVEDLKCLKHYRWVRNQMLASGAVGEIEHRQVVFSQRNRNVKIELAGASMLDTNYPANPETRPVLILKRVNANLFVYMILLAGNEGYDAINTRLKALSPPIKDCFRLK